MSVETSRVKQDLLLSYLREMAENIFTKPELQVMLEKLEDLYTEEFRHSYSEFFNLILELGKDGSGYDLTFLATNLMELTTLLDSTMGSKPGPKRKKFSKSLVKLSDHINLEIGRWNYYQLRDEQLRLTEARITDLSNKTNEASKETRKLKRQLDNAQKEYISILGIFASIILVLMTGITFSASVLESISQTNILLVIIAALTIGIVLFNIVYVLFYYIDSLVHEPKDRVIELWWVPNVIMGALLILALFGWFGGLVESRDHRINKLYPYAQEQVQQTVEVSSE